jgi:cytochrome c-type biogenesis protein CcmH
VALLPAGAAFAQQPTPSDDAVNAIAKQLYCPVCENIPLDVCPTQACAQWRDLIKLKLSQGWQSEQIRQYFAQVYGDRVLAAPPPEGLNLLVYIIPPVIFLAGIFIVYWVLRANRKPAPQVTPEDRTSQDPYVRQMEEELKRQK